MCGISVRIFHTVRGVAGHPGKWLEKLKNSKFPNKKGPETWVSGPEIGCGGGI
jgi:hypothetical protein